MKFDKLCNAIWFDEIFTITRSLDSRDERFEWRVASCRIRQDGSSSINSNERKREQNHALYIYLQVFNEHIQ